MSKHSICIQGLFQRPYHAVIYSDRVDVYDDAHCEYPLDSFTLGEYEAILSAGEYDDATQRLTINW